MKLFRKIDITTGNFLEDVLFENEPPFDDGSYISTPVPQGFYWPKWTGTEWVEGGQVSEPVEPQAPTVEQVAITLMQTQAELEDAIEALDFLIMGGM